MVKTKEEKNRYINEWKKQNKDRLYIIVPKGKKEHWKEYANNNNLSLSQLVSIAIDNYIEQQEQEQHNITEQEDVLQEHNNTTSNNRTSLHNGITYNR